MLAFSSDLKPIFLCKLPYSFSVPMMTIISHKQEVSASVLVLGSISTNTCKFTSSTQPLGPAIHVRACNTQNYSTLLADYYTTFYSRVPLYPRTESSLAASLYSNTQKKAGSGDWVRGQSATALGVLSTRHSKHSA